MDDLLIRMMRWGQQGYSCSQILLLLALEERRKSNPDLVRTMAGLAYGCGSSRATCGVLTGGCCALAFFGSDENSSGHPSEHLPTMVLELNDWFDALVGKAHGGITCAAIVGEAGPIASRQTCGALVADTYSKVMEILASYNIRI